MLPEHSTDRDTSIVQVTEMVTPVGAAVRIDIPEGYAYAEIVLPSGRRIWVEDYYVVDFDSPNNEPLAGPEPSKTSVRLDNLNRYTRGR